MNKSMLVMMVTTLGLLACAQTPNNVNLSVNQGACVTSQVPGYESVATQYSAAFPLNANLPGQSPYCAAITITNNNSGQNANNIQVNSTGLVVSYSVGSQSYSSSMIDYNAAGVSSSSFSGTVQQLGNIALFDPNNCVTTQGANVQTLGTNGGRCTFYVQITNEAMPVGVYPINLTISYTNGNATYSVGTSINQRVNLFVGSSQYPTISYTEAASSTPTPNTMMSANSPESYTPINAITRDAFGNVYTGDITGNIYQYNGASSSSWIQVTGLPSASAPVTSLASDNVGHVYAAIGSSVYQIESTNSGFIVNNIGTLPSESIALSINPTFSTLYASTGNSVYFCNLSSAIGSNCFNLLANSEIDANINQLNAASGGPVIAIESGVYQYFSNAWNPLVPDNAGLPSPAYAASLAYFLNPQASTVGTWYVGLNLPESAAPSVYTQSGSSTFSPLLSSTGNNPLTGPATQITTDSGQAIFVGGQLLYSQDFVNAGSSLTALAYLPSSQLSSSMVWTAITGINGTVTSMQYASQLTSY